MTAPPRDRPSSAAGAAASAGPDPADALLEQHRDALKALFPPPTPAQLQRPLRQRALRATLPLLAIAALGTILALDPAWSQHDYRTATGERRSLSLADGSRILLDADSRVQVSQHLRSRRAVLASGRARFEVAKSSWRRFQVDAGPVTVRNYGTVFDVERLGQSSDVTLWRGAVGVEVAGTAGELRLRPGQHLRAGLHRRARPEAAEAAAADWTDGRLQFEQAPLHEVVRRLQRYHDRPIVLDDPAIAALRVSGVFDSARAADALAVLPDILAVDVHRRDDGSVHIEARH